MTADFEQRLTKVEVEVKELRYDVTEIKGQLTQTATKKDLEDLKEFFAERDRIGGDRLWWITKALVLIFGAVVMAAFGIEQVSRWWGS